ncbi:MAG: hypothetical protein H7Y32_13690, partial [Chloroflexales bacterium]|nr:hypothetical protein [Chloroflexales bacterium]
MTTTQTQAPMVQLRQSLDAAERAVVTMYESPAGPAAMLRSIDEIYDLLE